MSDVFDIMLKIGITERRIRNPHCTQAAQQCRLRPARELPKGRKGTDLPFHFSGRPSASTQSSSRTGNAFFAAAISFALTPVRMPAARPARCQRWPASLLLGGNDV